VKPNRTTAPNLFGATQSIIAARASCRFSLGELAALRQEPVEINGNKLSPSTFKHSDNQTVAGLHAVSQAIRAAGMDGADFQEWGALACPRFFARSEMAGALTRYAMEGAWGISPHLIPHRSLHSVSGTLSQAMKLHGPNYGVGGGLDGVAETFLTGAALISGGALPGLWIVLTGFDPELVPTFHFHAEPVAPVADCIAVALALVPAANVSEGLVLTVGMDGDDPETQHAPAMTLERLAESLRGPMSMVRWTLPCGGWARIENVRTPLEI
jgi:hypothetical protein